VLSDVYVPHHCLLQSKDWYREEDVGAGIAASGLPREQLFLTSKLHPRDHGYNSSLKAFERSLGHLNTSYLDLFLLHYPNCFAQTNCAPKPHNRWQDSWKALEAVHKAGKVHSIGKPAALPAPADDKQWL
jgi:diketogulonate reductase-like aldo/keto reductase